MLPLHGMIRPSIGSILFCSLLLILHYSENGEEMVVAKCIQHVYVEEMHAYIRRCALYSPEWLGRPMQIVVCKR